MLCSVDYTTWQSSVSEPSRYGPISVRGGHDRSWQRGLLGIAGVECAWPLGLDSRHVTGKLRYHNGVGWESIDRHMSGPQLPSENNRNGKSYLTGVFS